MKPATGYHLIGPDDLQWRPSNLMKILNADFLERTGSENLSARLWRLPPGSANTLHRHLRQEEFYFVLEGVGRIRISPAHQTPVVPSASSIGGWETLTVPKHGGVLVGPEQLRQVFNDTDAETLWLIVGAPEELEFLPTAPIKPDLSLIYPEDPTQLPPELAGKQWPPKE
ncbi:MAG: hypothetical protein QOE70_1945 [Chthoniobacter sp.]|jgi:hypothetical protein|nr:hypothetical protein [Chthoniobacter sp.]